MNTHPTVARRRPRRTRIIGGIGLAAVSLLAVPTRSTAADHTTDELRDRGRPAEIRWDTCATEPPRGTRCGTLEVPSDWGLDRLQDHAVRCHTRAPAATSFAELAFGLAQQLPNGRVISRDGDDYSVPLFSPCVGAAYFTYLVDQTLPEPGTVCTD